MFRTRLAILTLVVLAPLLGACGGGTSANDLAAARKEAGTINGLCPVREQLVTPGNWVDYKDRRIGFCCGPCKAIFMKDPEKYMALMKADHDKFGYHP